MAALLLLLASDFAGLVGPAHGQPRATVTPATVQPGDVAVVEVQGVSAPASVEGTLGGRALAFFPLRGGLAALVGIDLEVSPGPRAWRITVVAGDGPSTVLSGELPVEPRDFPVESLTLPRGMVELDREATRRADLEARRLRRLYATATPERLWRGSFVPPVAAARRSGGFGARRVINGLSRSPHTGLDYSADRGTPVVAVNAGRVVLTREFFFPGRLVIVDHGLGLYSAYFHLERIGVAEEDLVARGAPIGTVGATGRTTGPHLHFAVTLGSARVDPTALLGLRPSGED